MSKRQIQLDLVTTEGYNTLVKWKDGVSFSLPAGTGSGSLFHLVPVAHVEENDASKPKNKGTDKLLASYTFKPLRT